MSSLRNARSKTVYACGFVAWLASMTSQAATFSLTPGTIASGSTNALVLSIGGLANRQQVLIEEFRDANGNGLIDPGEELVLCFKVSDGETAPFVPPPGEASPGDDDGATNGHVTKALTLSVLPECVRAVGNYVIKVSALDGSFNSLTQSLGITPGAYAQAAVGTVRAGGVPVPSAMVALLSVSGDDNEMVTAALTDAAGHFSMTAPPDDYLLLPLKPGYVADMGNGQGVSLVAGINSTQDVVLLPAGSSISGRVVDALTAEGVPGLQLFLQSPDGLVALGITDTNGDFSVAVTPGTWKVETSERGLALLGYGKKNITVDATGGSVSGVQLSLSRARGSFQLSFYFPSGNFGGGTNGILNFPTHLQYYYGLYNLNDANYPTNVLFTGPAGSGLSNTASAMFGGSYGGGDTFYSSPQVNTPPYPPGGVYEVNYKGLPQRFSLPNPDAQNRQVLLLPTVIVDAAGALTEVRWSYRDINGTPIASPPFLARINIQVEGIGGRLYDGEASPGQTNHSVSSPVTWTNVNSLQLTYNDTLDNQYASFWTQNPVGGGAKAPRLEIRPPIGPGQFGLRLVGEPGRSYSLEYSTTLTNWFTLLTTNTTGTTLDLVDTGATNQARYYRVRMNP